MPGQKKNGQDNTSYYDQGKKKKSDYKTNNGSEPADNGYRRGPKATQTVIDDEEKRSIILCERISITNTTQANQAGPTWRMRNVWHLRLRWLLPDYKPYIHDTPPSHTNHRGQQKCLTRLTGRMSNVLKCKYNEARKKTENTNTNGKISVLIIRPRHSKETSFILIGLFIALNIWFGFFGFRALCGFNGLFYFSGPPQDYMAKWAIFSSCCYCFSFESFKLPKIGHGANVLDPISGPALFICFWPFLYCLFWLIFGAFFCWTICCCKCLSGAEKIWLATRCFRC